MKVLRLTLENFRQFQGKHEIRFGHDPRIHLIYAANGAGKTTILNAFTWCLYKKLSRDFENPDGLVNKVVQHQLEDGQSASASVQVQFEHEGAEYLATRREEVRKTDGALERTIKGDITLTRIDDSGERTSIGNPSVAIDQILPMRLHEFFFLNGERIEHLVKPTAYEDIEDAIKTLLGLEILDRSVKHLAAVQSNLRQELKRVGDIETQEILEDIDRYESDRDATIETLKDLRGRLEAQEDERQALSDRLVGYENARALQEERAALNREKLSIEQQQRQLEEELNRLLANRGWLAFVTNLVTASREIIETNRDRGELPTTYKEQFIVDLLDKGLCICGTHLDDGSPARLSVETWREGGGLDGVEESASRLGGFAANFAGAHTELHESLARNAGRKRGLQTRNREVDERLDEISKMLSEDDDTDIVRLETQRRKAENRIAELRADERSERRHQDDLTSSLERRNKDLQKAQQQNAESVVARRRVEMVGEVRSALSGIYDVLRNEVRAELDQKVKQVYSGIMVKSYEPEITEDFQLQITDPTYGSDRVALSVGENQVLTLSFVGALADLARPSEGSGLLAELGLGSTFTGGHFPIVLDAPWGSLDTNYRRGVASALPTLADQVIVLVSKSQGLGEVRKELIGSATGQTVVHMLTPRSDVEEQTVHLDGHDYPYISVAPDGVERSEVIDVGGGS